MRNPPEEVLNLQPDRLLAWIQQRLRGEVPSDPCFNWHGLAEVAAMHARSDDDSLIWGEIAVSVYAWLAARSEAQIAASYALSEMHVRANLIAIHGAKSGDRIRDPHALLAWFRDNRKLSLREALALAPDWQLLPVTEAARLRAIKNQLAVLERVISYLNPADRDEIQSWMDLRPNLP